MSNKHQGSCLCGGIRFSVEGVLAPIQICHCIQCHKAQGGPIATNIPVDVRNLTFESGEDLLRFFESSPGKVRAFCTVCGSPVFSRRTALPGVVRIRAGLLDEPVRASLGFHAHVTSKASWWPIDDELPRYEQGAPAPTRSWRE